MHKKYRVATSFDLAVAAQMTFSLPTSRKLQHSKVCLQIIRNKHNTDDNSIVTQTRLITTH